MKLVHSLAIASVLGAFCTPALAIQADEHAGHHPPAAATALPKAGVPAPAPAVPLAPPAAAQPGPAMAGMDTQMQAMAAMHEKMMAAKTPEARKALMAEHMKMMKDGMTMMDGVSMGATEPMQCDMAGQHPMMEKRMQMMQSMMQMMMDRLASSPAK